MRRREFIAGLGTAAAWPAVAQAQRSETPVVGFLSPGSPESDVARESAVRRGLAETGYVVGRNVTIEYRWAQGRYNQLPELAADLVRSRVSVIVTVGVPGAIAAKAATSTVPIVFNIGVDPVAADLVASFGRPGGNMTGVALLSVQLVPKRLELLHASVPTARVVALLANSANPVTDAETKELDEGARALRLEQHVLLASTTSEIDAAFETLAQLRADALIVSVDPFFTNQRSQIVEQAARHRVPTIYGWGEFPAAGGLMSYGPSLTESYRQVGIYVGQILGGGRPIDLPIQQVVNVELVINLKTAKALGLTIPETQLATADQVIE